MTERVTDSCALKTFVVTHPENLQVDLSVVYGFENLYDFGMVDVITDEGDFLAVTSVDDLRILQARSSMTVINGIENYSHKVRDTAHRLLASTFKVNLDDINPQIELYLHNQRPDEKSDIHSITDDSLIVALAGGFTVVRVRHGSTGNVEEFGDEYRISTGNGIVIPRNVPVRIKRHSTGAWVILTASKYMVNSMSI